MRLISTRPPHHEVSLRQAVLEDPSPDGGLYLPISLPRLSSQEVEALEGVTFPVLAERLALRLFEPSIGGQAVERIVESAFDFPIPLVQSDENTWILELFHGPTGSFKDFGARFLACLLSVLRNPDEGPVIILVATSGDTGGAVAHAVRGLEGVRAMVLFPRDWLSPVQLRQIVEPAERDSAKNEGVIPVEVDGTFDDCQRMVKEVLARPGPSIRAMLTSANSVNIGRLLPQAFYYAQGWNSLPPDARKDPVASVPTGNLGNLTAGVIARRMGIPLGHFIAASNANAAMSRFLEAGTLPAGPSLKTVASAMDVARPSNLERLIAIFDGNVEALQSWITPTRHEDPQVLETMGRIYRDSGYLLDPHSAVGYLGLESHRTVHPHAPGMILATADPAKFPDTVLRATGSLPPEREDWHTDEEQPDPGSQPGATVRLGSDPDNLRALLRRQ
jgi:threonine synthase